MASLARAHKDIADDYTWMRAILNRGTLESVLLYVDLFIGRVLGGECPRLPFAKHSALLPPKKKKSCGNKSNAKSEAAADASVILIRRSVDADFLSQDPSFAHDPGLAFNLDQDL